MRAVIGLRSSALGAVAAVLLPLAIVQVTAPTRARAAGPTLAVAPLTAPAPVSAVQPTPAAAPAQAAGTTSATTVPTPDPADLSPGWEQRWGAAALAGISYPWQQLGYSVEFLSGRPGLLGATFPSSHTVEIFVRQGETFDRMKHALAHELGHVVDLKYGNAGRRAQWQTLRGIDTSHSWFLWGGRDYASPAGDFAETFAYWQAGPSDYSDYGPPTDLAPLLPFFNPAA